MTLLIFVSELLLLADFVFASRGSLVVLLSVFSHYCSDPVVARHEVV